MASIIPYALSALIVFSPALVLSGEIVSTSEDQQEIRLSVYNNDLALIRDRRTLSVGKGIKALAFREVSSRIKPETALLKADDLRVLEQNFEYDLLSPQSMLQKYVGKKVILATVNPVTGVEREEAAEVLSSGTGVVLKTKDHIITDVRGQLLFPDVPENLRDRPTLTMLVSSEESGPRNAELTYLSKGLSWKADYIAELNDNDDEMQLKGWVTLTNNSGVTYKNAGLRLIAGDVNLVRDQPVPARGLRYEAMADSRAREDEMARQAMFEYHLYTLGRKTTIAENQQKQVALMHAEDVACSKHYLLRGADYYYRRNYAEIGKKLRVGVFVTLKNEKESGLGEPLPAGVVRVYKKDGNGFLQFIGEDRIVHTPEGENVRLKLGDAFDVTADKRQTDFSKISGGREGQVLESEYEITIRNAKKEAVTVRVEEPVPGDWKVVKESIPHRKEAAHILSWDVEVPPEGSAKLSYRVRIRF